jgi:hypothetical protein
VASAQQLLNMGNSILYIRFLSPLFESRHSPTTFCFFSDPFFIGDKDLELDTEGNVLFVFRNSFLPNFLSFSC